MSKKKKESIEELKDNCYTKIYPQRKDNYMSI